MFLHHDLPRNLCTSQAGHVNKCQFLLFPNDHRTLLFPLVNSDFPSIVARALQDNNRACGCYLELTLCSLSSIFVVNCLSSRCRRTNLKPYDSFFLFILMAQAGFAVDASHFKTGIVVVDCVLLLLLCSLWRKWLSELEPGRMYFLILVHMTTVCLVWLISL